MINKATTRVNRPFYGWTSLAGASLQQITGGAYIFTFGIFLPVICSDLGWDRASLSLAVALGTLCFGLPGPLIGITIAKYGPRIHVILGNALVALGLAGMFFVKETWHVYLLYCLMGIGAGAGFFLAGSVVANNWFEKRRPLAMSIVAAALGIGGFLFPPLTSALITSFNWRVTFLILAAIVLIFGVIVSGVVLVRNKPEDLGQFPDGEKPVNTDKPHNDPKGLPVNTGAVANWTTRQAMRNPIMWLIVGFCAANLFGFGVMMTHQAAHLQDLGFNPITAAMTLSVVSALNVVGMLGVGILALKIKIRYLACASLALELISMVIILNTSNLGLIYVYAGLFGLGSGALATIETTIIAAYFGRVNFSKILGMVVPILMVIEAAGPIIAGLLYVSTGNYQITFIIIAILTLLGLIMAFLARPPALPGKQRALDRKSI